MPKIGRIEQMLIEMKNENKHEHAEMRDDIKLIKSFLGIALGEEPQPVIETAPITVTIENKANWVTTTELVAMFKSDDTIGAFIKKEGALIDTLIAKGVLERLPTGAHVKITDIGSRIPWVAPGSHGCVKFDANACYEYLVMLFIKPRDFKKYLNGLNAAIQQKQSKLGVEA